MAIIPGLTKRRWRPGPRIRATDRACDTRDFVKSLYGPDVTPGIAQNEQGRSSAIYARATTRPGHHCSQRWRVLVEDALGRIEPVGAGGKLRYLGRARNKLWFELTAAYYLTRLANIEAAAV